MANIGSRPARRSEGLSAAYLFGGPIALLIAVIALVGVTRRKEPAPDPFAEVVQHLAPGQIAFESPIKMKLNETIPVEVRIAKQMNQDIATGMAKIGNVQIDQIKVARLMSVKLVGSAFDVTPITSEDQILADDAFTSWSWTIHPHDWGHQSLYLSVCARFEIKSQKEEKQCAPVYQRAVTVEVAPIYAATHFIANNAVWSLGIVGSGLASVAGALAWLFKRKKKIGFG